MGTGTTSASSRDAAPRRPDGSPARLLVVDDETVLTDLLVDSLTFAGFQAHTAHSGSEALTQVRQVRPDLVLLDVNLPDFNGFAVAARLRAQGNNTPIVYLTARDAPADLRDGFGTGADDYLTKPFRLEELLMRVEAVLRRTLGTSVARGDVITIADLVIDARSRQASRGDTVLSLTGPEYELLRHLAVNRNKVLSASDITSHLRDADAGRDVAGRIAALKTKVDFRSPSLVHTAGTSGYILRVPKP